MEKLFGGIGGPVCVCVYEITELGLPIGYR